MERLVLTFSALNSCEEQYTEYHCTPERTVIKNIVVSSLPPMHLTENENGTSSVSNIGSLNDGLP